MDIELHNLSIGYAGGRTVAAAICATFRGGRLSCVIGSNGTGKSTLLKTISGYLPTRGGTVSIGGRDISTLPHGDMARTVGIVLTATPDVRNLTVAEMVGLGRSPYTGFWGTLRREDKEAVANAMRMVGIGGLAGRMTHTLSDGERQKVMIARALAQQTPVILLDEPTAFLDYPSKVELMKLLRRLAHDGGKTIVASTHDLGLAVELADDIYIMYGGTLSTADREKVRADMARLVRSTDEAGM